MIASEFVTKLANILQADKTRNSFYSEVEIFVNLTDAYIDIRKHIGSDISIFKSVGNITGLFEVEEYVIEQNITNITNLYVNNKEFKKLAFESYISSNANNIFALNIDRIFIKNLKGGEKIRYYYSFIKELKDENSFIELPNYFYESLRLLTLSKILEKDRSENYTKNANSYYERYILELKLIKNMYINSKNPRYLNSKYQF